MKVACTVLRRGSPFEGAFLSDIAILLGLLTYKLSIILYEIIETIYTHQNFYKHLFIGMGSYLFLWIFIFNNIRGNWFLTIEHELTHTIFALLTFHKIIDFKASNSGGGYMQFSGVGRGNWLITIAPYFFPTFSMIVILFIYISQPQYHYILVGILGYSTIYHIHSTWSETSLNQPDIQEVGIPFAILFLPSANLLAIIAILSAIPYDGIIFSDILNRIYQYSLIHINSYSYFLLKLNNHHLQDDGLV